MKKMLQVFALTAIGLMSMPGLFARPQVQSSGRVQTHEGLQYKVYKDNGQFIGSCTVGSLAELESYAQKMGKGTYLFVPTGNSLTADRRIIVYFGGNGVSADRRIIVY